MYFLEWVAPEQILLNEPAGLRKRLKRQQIRIKCKCSFELTVSQ